jgi:hypothetical protein
MHLSHEGLQTCTEELYRALHAIYRIPHYSADVDAFILNSYAPEDEMNEAKAEMSERVTVEKVDDGADGAAAEYGRASRV